MMKHKGSINYILVASIALIMIVAICCILFFIPKDKAKDGENFGEELTIGEQLLAVRDLTELKDIVEKSKLDLVLDEETIEYNLYDIECFQNKAQFVYKFKEDNSLSQMSLYFTLFGYEEGNTDNPTVVTYTADDLKDSSMKMLQSFQDYLGVSYVEHYYVFGTEGMLDSSSTDSFQQIKDGKANLEFTAKDKDGSLWMMQTITSNGVALCLIEHYVELGDFADFIPNVTVE